MLKTIMFYSIQKIIIFLACMAGIYFIDWIIFESLSRWLYWPDTAIDWLYGVIIVQTGFIIYFVHQRTKKKVNSKA